jgi:hypothetical protein
LVDSIAEIVICLTVGAIESNLECDTLGPQAEAPHGRLRSPRTTQNHVTLRFDLFSGSCRNQYSGGYIILNAIKRSCNIVLSQIAFCASGLLLASFTAQASTVTLNLGQTAQNVTLAGLGANASGLGRYNVTLGTCTPAGGNTTCILSGSFTGTTAGFFSGTYSLATTYVGTGASPLQGVQQSAGSDLYSFSSIPSTATMTLTLVSSSGTTVVPIEAGSQFAAGATFAFFYGTGAGAATCSGSPVSSCSVNSVGLVNGAVITGQATGSAAFIVGNNYYISQLAFSAGWQSTLTYINYSTQQVTCTTNFYSDSGSPLSVPFGQGTISTRTDTLPPGGSVHDQTAASLTATLSQGWAQASCNGPVQASLLYRLYTAGVPVGEAAVNAETAPTTEFATFAQTSTGVAYANPSTTQSATITLQVYSTTGAQLGSEVINLGPLSHGAANLGPALGLASFTGFVKITSTIPILSVSLNAEAFPVFSALPPGDLPGDTVMVP